MSTNIWKQSMGYYDRLKSLRIPETKELSSHLSDFFHKLSARVHEDKPLQETIPEKARDNSPLRNRLEMHKWLRLFSHL